jgi:hypothetical protein
MRSTESAARGADVIDLVVPLRMVLSMESIACRSDARQAQPRNKNREEPV